MSYTPDPDIPDAVIPEDWSPALPEAVTPGVYKVGTSLATAINVQNVRIKLGSLSTDEAEIFLNLNVSASLPTVLQTTGAWVTIYKDDVGIFMGTVQNRRQTWGATSESQSIKLKGLWDYFERNYWVWPGGYYNSSSSNQTLYLSGDTMASALNKIIQWPATLISSTIVYASSHHWVSWTYTTGLTYRITRDGVFSGYWSPTPSAPYYLADDYATHTYKVYLDLAQLGTVDLETFVIPDFVLRSFTYADGIRAILRYSPNCIQSTDYSTSPPKINFLKASSTSLTEFKTWQATASGGIPYAVKKFEWMDRDDLKLSSVVVSYWREYTKAWRSFDSGGISEWTEKYMWLESQDTATGTNTGIVMRQMIQMEGARKDNIIRFDTTRINGSTAYSTLVSYRASPYPLWPNLIWLATASNLATYGAWLNSSTAYGSAYTIDAVKNITEVCGSDYANFYWVRDEEKEPPRELWATSSFDGFQGCELQLMLQFRQPIPNNNLGFDQPATIRLWKIPSGYSGSYFSRTINQNDSTLPSPPSGIAASVQAAAANLTAQGTCEIEWNEPIIPGPLARKIITPTGSVGLIQGIDVDLAAGSVTVTFGSPTQLRPDDVKRLFFAQVDELPGAKTGA